MLLTSFFFDDLKLIVFINKSCGLIETSKLKVGQNQQIYLSLFFIEQAGGI